MAPSNLENTARVMPDIAAEARPALAGVLDWVGMGEIEMPVALHGEAGRTLSSGARVNAFVNLKRGDVRGIHMSRLYLHVDKALSAEPVTPASICRLLKDFLESHADLSDRAMVSLRFDHLVRRAALASDNSGWKSYPVSITGVMDRGHFALELGVEAAYSSTCPCSAALARQLIQEQFQFNDEQLDEVCGLVPDALKLLLQQSQPLGADHQIAPPAASAYLQNAGLNVPAPATSSVNNLCQGVLHQTRPCVRIAVSWSPVSSEFRTLQTCSTYPQNLCHYLPTNYFALKHFSRQVLTGHVYTYCC